MIDIVRVLVAKPGLDGHDRGAKVVARALRDAGCEVIYTGLHQTPEMVVHASIQEDVDIIGLSILSGAHVPLVAAVLKLLRKQNVLKPVFVGGIIPEDDARELKKMGVAAVFGPGSALGDIVEHVKQIAQGGSAAPAKAKITAKAKARAAKPKVKSGAKSPARSPAKLKKAPARSQRKGS